MTRMRQRLLESMETVSEEIAYIPEVTLEENLQEASDFNSIKV